LTKLWSWGIFGAFLRKLENIARTPQKMFRGTIAGSLHWAIMTLILRPHTGGIRRALGAGVGPNDVQCGIGGFAVGVLMAILKLV
jgi:hypothetical protein